MDYRIETEHGSCVVRPYQTGDESGVLSLWKTAFGKSLSPRLWRWKYLENPYPVQIGLAVGEDGRILVMYGGIPYQANCQGRRVTITHLMDIMSHPECRGSGLFVKTGRAFFDLFAGPDRTCFYYGFPGQYHFDIGKKYLDYTAIRGGVVFLTARTGTKGPVNRWGGRIAQIADIDGRFDRFWYRQCTQYPLAVIRDSAFLNWRFFEHPLNRYELWAYQPHLGKKVKAYAVFAVKGEKARMLDVVAPDSETLIKDFLIKMLSHFHNRHIQEIETWLPPHHFLTRAVLSAGFKPVQEPMGFIPTGRSFHPELSMEWASDTLFYTMADGDLL